MAGGNKIRRLRIGAWFVLAGMGLFDVKGGSDASPSIQMAMPLFQKVTVKLHPDFYSGKAFVVRVKGNPSEEIYIRSAQLNGQKLNSFQFPWNKFVKGGELILETSD